MKWQIAEARQRFSELLKLAAREPQTICNRDQPVAAVVSMEALEDLQALRARREQQSVAEAFGDLRRIFAEEDGAFHESPRSDRANPFLEALDEHAR